ncbi:MAG TPA: enoyl-CoA hydratase/isomerase family protein [Candidatus Binataceae bacterium]|nr:enoyl-CoA hydratase/isomerase family protein [Candidatus Binataceae bacterium]
MASIKLADYAMRYKHVAMERREGILQMTFHTTGDELKWSAEVHEEMSYAFYDVARDYENRCVIMTGAGEAFCAAMDTGGGPAGLQVDEDNVGAEKPAPPPAGIPSTTWDHIYSDAKYLLTNLLNIETPMIAAVNGPALIHAELAVMCDIVIAADHAVFQDAPHFPNGIVPGDGVHIVWPLILGPNRGRYFLLTGQKIAATEALRLGVVSEVVTPAQLLPRAWELARQIVARPSLTTRYARVALAQQLKKLMLENLGYGLALEGLGGAAFWPGAKN